MKPFFEKYRPTCSNDLVLDDEIKFLFESINKNPINMPNLIFHGSPGTGKTSSMINLLKNIFHNNYKNYVLELNASDERNIKTVREVIKDFCETKNNFRVSNKTFYNFKVVVLDEVDSMTFDAQFCLRRMMETYSNNIRFILICNYLNKIIKALQSRCCVIKFKQLDYDIFKKRLDIIIKNENINISNENLKFICYICDGDLRKILNLLQNLKNYNCFDKSHIIKYTGFPSIEIIKEIIYLILNKEDCYNELLEIIDNNNLNLVYIVKELYIYLNTLNISNKKKILLINNLSNIEKNHYYLMEHNISLFNIITLIREIFYTI
jgi:replication factor C subunit 3/5